MEAMCGHALQFPTCIGSKKDGGKLNVVLGFNRRCRKEHGLRVVSLSEFQQKCLLDQQMRVSLEPLRLCKDSQAPLLGSENFCNSFDGNWLLKTKAQEIAPCLNGRCIFLVGMMGSGKTTVGKILSDALNYSFVDSDRYVEQAVGGISVTEIFKQFGESFFRENESQALRKLSLMPQQVVATGGGAVVQPINWKHMRQGITVFLDVPLDALARRIAAVGTDSRPLLHFESGDAYTKAFMGLFTLSKKRAEAYACADTTVSLINLAANMGLEDLTDITPTAIATEVLVQIEKFVGGNSGMSIRMFP